MLKVQRRYIIRPTVSRLWIRNGLYGEWKSIKYEFYEATLKTILKTKFKFEVDDKGLWSMPFHAVEIYDIINKPLSRTEIMKQAGKALHKFSQGGFTKLSDDELRIILAYCEIVDGYRSNPQYPLEIAANCISIFINRAHIIRTLRNTYEFRNTEDNRHTCLKYYKENLKGEFSCLLQAKK